MMPTKIVLAAVLALVPACLDFDYTQWRDVPTADIHAESPDGYPYAAEWSAKIASAIESWRAVLPEACAVPFRLVDEQTIHPIRLVYSDDWRFERSAVGVTEDDLIEVREDSAVRLVLIHELGHAMGLGHTPEGTVSIMVPRGGYVSEPQPVDAAAAACALGCGPC